MGGTAQSDADVRRLLDAFSGTRLIGGAPAFVDCLRRLDRLARWGTSVLIGGETGTGKDLAARALHYLGPRRSRPFVPVNCGALPDALFEAELFGHARGAFTDAHAERVGLVELAAGGTLFLDEVDSLTAKAQVALLRFLQDRTYRPLGGGAERRSDVAVIAATNEDLRARVDRELFRRDLYYRLRVADVEMPPLRARRADIALLARHFVRVLSAQYDQRLKAIAPEALRWLEAQEWPGNVRELENVIHRAFLLGDERLITVADLAEDVAAPPAGPTPFEDARAQVMRDFERRYLVDLMQQALGNVSRAARMAGKDRRSLGRLLRKHGIRRAEFGPHG